MEALKTRLLIIRFSIGSHRGLNQPRNVVFAQALRTDGWMDGRTDRPSYREAFLTDASTILLKNIVSPIWLICDQTTEKNILKSVTISKSKKKFSKCRQAELSSLIHLDFRAKTENVHVYKRQKIWKKMRRRKLTCLFLLFLGLS